MATIQDLGKVAYFNKGVYNSETSYEINDVVSYNGSSYVSLGNNNQGNLPTNATYWSVVALKGEKGDTGKPFVIEKTYETIEDMVADYDNMNVNDYVMIQGSIEDEENATLWTKTETEVSPYKWVYLADFSGASGITGQTPNIQIGTVTEGNEPAVTRRAGSSNENPILDFVLKTGAKGDTGATGNGISNVSKTGTSDLTDTYTITYTNGNSTTFDVSNGKGIVSIVKTGTSGLVDTYTITYNDGTTSTYTVTNGEDGEVTQAQLDETNSEVELLKKIYNAFPTTSGEDEIVTLNGTAKVNFKNIDLKGNTSQNTTEGKNLFNKTDYSTISTSTNGNATNVSKTSNSISFTSSGSDNYSGIYIPSGNIQDYIDNFDSDANYYISVDVTTDKECTFGSLQTTTNYQALPIGKTRYSVYGKITSSINFYVRNAVSGGVNIKIENIMISTSSDTTYEPYTYGPSPNPDYPQEVKVVTGNNTIKVEGKNLFDKNNYNSINAYFTANSPTITSSSSDRTIYIPCEPNTTYTISKNLVAYGRAVGYTSTIPAISSSVEGVIIISANNVSGTITTGANANYLVIRAFNAGQDTLTYQQVLASIQIEKSSTASTFEPYVSQSYQVNLGSMELCKIGNYQDYIYKNNDKWYLEKQIDKVILNGSEDWVLQSINSYGIANFRIVINGYIMGTNNYSICDMFSPQTSLIADIQEVGYLLNTIGQLYIRFDSSIASTIATFKTWLSTHNTTIYYVLETPTVTEITDNTLIGQLNDLERAYSYEEQTTISQTNSNKPFIITAEAILSLKDILNS